MAKKGINDVIKLLKNNAEHGRAFHEHFEDVREQLLAEPWRRNDTHYQKSCQIAAAFIQAEILDQFNLKSLSRRD
jgi:hypothetical protein